MNIIELAKQAGFADSAGVVHAAYQLETFAALVAAHEREECAKVCEEVGKWPSLGPKDCAYSIRERSNT